MSQCPSVPSFRTHATIMDRPRRSRAAARCSTDVPARWASLSQSRPPPATAPASAGRGPSAREGSATLDLQPPLRTTTSSPVTGPSRSGTLTAAAAAGPSARAGLATRATRSSACRDTARSTPASNPATPSIDDGNDYDYEDMKRRSDLRSLQCREAISYDKDHFLIEFVDHLWSQ